MSSPPASTRVTASSSSGPSWWRRLPSWPTGRSPWWSAWWCHRGFPRDLQPNESQDRTDTVKRIRVAIMLSVWAAALAACGGGNSNTTGGSPAASAGSTTCPAGSGSSGNGAKVSIGSKGFAEEQLLATMTKQVLEKHGFTVDYSLQAKDTAIGNALVSGQIDMLWQYTRTELTHPGYLNLTSGVPTDLDQAFQLVKQKDEARGLCWTSQAPMDDTNRLGIKASDRATFGDTLSAFATYLGAPPHTKICILS